MVRSNTAVLCPVLVFLLFGTDARIVRAAPQSPPQSDEKNSRAVRTPEGQSTPATIRVSTRLVQASVVVEDKRGKPVAGLKKEDFTLFDDKQPQEIATFSVTTNRPSNAGSPLLEPDTFSNRAPGSRDVPPNVAMILLDGLNTRFTDQAFAREQVIKFLLQIQPQDRVALYTLGNELEILHDFTSDATALLEALKKQRSRVTPSLDASEPEENGKDFNVGPSARDDLLGGLLNGRPGSTNSQNEANFFFLDRAQRTLSALLQIVSHLGSLPERKTLIWVSGSFPLIPSYMFYGINAPAERLFSQATSKVQLTS